MSAIYKFNIGPSSRSTVVHCEDGSCLELRRGDITWTRAFKAAHPEVQQCRWSSLESWWATLPVEMPPVEKWHQEGGWTGPSAAVAGETVYGLSTHLAYFLRCDYATKAQVSEGLDAYACYVIRTDAPSEHLESVFGFFLPAEKSDNTFNDLLAAGHVYGVSDADAATRGYRLAWPSVTQFNLSGLRPVLDDEGPLEFASSLAYFMGGFYRGSWADIQRVYEAYMMSKAGGVHPLVEEGSVVTDTFLRHVLQTKERTIPWSTFRRLLLERGLVWMAQTQTQKETESLPELIVEPVEVKRPVARRLSFGEAPMEIDEAAWLPAPKAEAVVTPPPHRPEPEVLFAELDALWDRVMEETEGCECGDYHIVLMEEFLEVCLHEKYAAAWRGNTFKRIQMRASLRCWMGDHGENAVVRRFMDTVPGAM
jgi:hypothetical protein